MTTPSFRAINTSAQAFSMSISCTVPATAQEGDLLIFAIGTTGGNPSTPSGFTLVDSQIGTDGTYFANLHVYWKWCEAADIGASKTFTISGGNTSMAAMIAAYSGVQIDPTGNATGTYTSDTSIDAPAVAGSTSSTTTVAIYLSGNGRTITVPNTSRAAWNSNGSWTPFFRMATGDDNNDPNTVRTATLSSSDTRRVAATVVLTATSVVKHYDGSTWVEKPLYRWDGSDWVPTVLKHWNGTSWEAV